MKKTHFIIKIMVVLLFFTLIVLSVYHLHDKKHFGKVKCLSVHNQNDQELILKYIQTRIGMDFPSHTEFIEIATQHGKDTIVMVKCYYSEEVDRYFLASNKFTEDICGIDQLAFFPDRWRANVSQNKLCLRRSEDLWMVVCFVNSSQLQEKYIYFCFIDNRMPVELSRRLIPAVAYQYDSQGRLLSLTDPVGNTTALASEGGNRYFFWRGSKLCRCRVDM